MSYIPIIKAARLIPVLIKAGFHIVRQKGSHAQLQHLLDPSRRVTIPMHNKDLTKATLVSILRQAKISLREFLQMLGR